MSKRFGVLSKDSDGKLVSKSRKGEKPKGVRWFWIPMRINSYEEAIAAAEASNPMENIEEVTWELGNTGNKCKIVRLAGSTPVFKQDKTDVFNGCYLEDKTTSLVGVQYINKNEVLVCFLTGPFDMKVRSNVNRLTEQVYEVIEFSVSQVLPWVKLEV